MLTIYHKAKGMCLECGYPHGTHRPDCPRVEQSEIEDESAKQSSSLLLR